MFKRCGSIFCLLLVTGCTNQLTVLTEEIEYIQPVDFVGDLGVVFDEKVDVPLLAEEDVEDKLDIEVILIEEALADLEEFDEVMMPKAVGIPLTVEALVGQVNGRPVYANKVLEPVADQIEAFAKNATRPEFSNFIKKFLYSEEDQMGITVRAGRIYQLVISDLVLSEAVSGLSMEQSFGLLAIFGQMKDDLVSSQGGSQTQLRHLLAQQADLSVEKFIEFQREQILINALYQQKIRPKVNVTWRDIQREFEQISLGEPVLNEVEDVERTRIIVEALKSTPPTSLGNIEVARGTVTLGKIRLPIEDSRVTEVREAFATGESFSVVAEQVGFPNGGIWDTFKMGLGGVEDIIVVDEIKQHLVGVKLGDFVEPFEFGSDLMWLAVLDVQQPISLYNRNVQIALHSVLWNVQFHREKNRYVESLWGDGSLKEVKTMADRVANIAMRRYKK